jgi:site-specific DNA-methyltransferase (adenine-specific)
MTPQLINGDCLTEMAKLPARSVDLILTDPPYFKVKSDAWDRQWEKPAEFLKWLDAIAAEWQRILKPNGSLYCFASPQMAARVECQIMERFRVLNAIVWAKNHTQRGSIARRCCLADLRSFFTEQERIIFAEHYGADNMAKGEAGYMAKCDELRGFLFEPLRSYLVAERDRAGHTTKTICEALKCTTASHYFSKSQWALPTEKHYQSMRELFNKSGSFEYLRKDYEDLRKDYEDLRKDYEYLRKDYEDLRRPFSVSSSVPYTDVWTFETVQGYKGKHPCEKPQKLLRHIIEASSRPGDVVLDCFLGSGSTGIACRELGRKFIGIELDPEYFRKASEAINGGGLLHEQG